MARRAFSDDWHLLSRLKFRQIHLVVALDNLGNLRRAAERVHMTQPAATRLLGQIERALGVALFERTARGMLPTASGAALIHGAREILGTLVRTGEELSAIDSGATGSVNVGALIAATPDLLPRAIARFKALRPKVTVSVVESNHERLVSSLREGALDLVVGRLVGDASASGLTLRALHAEPMRAVVRPGHPLAARRRRPLALHGLAGHSWIWPGRETPYRQRLEAAFRGQGADPPGHLVESVSLPMNLSLLRDSDFVGVMPRNVADFFAAAKLLAVLDVELPDPTGPIGLITRSGQAMAPATREFVEFLAQVSKELAAPG